MPESTFLYKASEASMTPEDRAMAWSPNNQYQLLEKIRPQVAIWCNPFTFFLNQDYRSDCMLAVDLHGPTNIENCYILGKPIKDTTRDLLEKLTSFDQFVTVCQEQLHYLSALLCAAGIPARDINISVVPVSIPSPGKIRRNIDEELSIIFSGGFYPWQDPSRILLLTGKVLEKLDCGTLHIYGSPHTNLSSARIDSMMSELSRMKRVQLHGYVTHDALIRRYATSTCALDLMPRNLERELAVTTRTVEYVAFGVPPVYNNYAPLAKYISQYDAGWCLDPDDLKSYEKFIEKLVAASKDEFVRKSQNALALSAAEFSLQKTVEPLVQICRSPKIRNSRENNRPVSFLKLGKKQPRVAVFTQDNFAVRQLRVVQPLDALKRSGRIAGYSVFLNTQEQGPDSFDAYDAIWIQRTVMESLLRLVEGRPFLFDIDDLLVGRPSYTSISVFQRNIIQSLLLRKCTLSVTNHRLYELLKRYAKGRIPDRVFITPNGFDFPRAAVTSSTKPKALIWTSSDAAALTTSYDDVLDAIDEFSGKRQLPVYLIGRFDARSSRRKPRNSVSFGNMDYWRHKAFLASQPTMLGICPLETHADESTLDFVAAKSDLKMVEYGGFGHPGVYSQSPPYTESDLKTGVLTLNTSEGWLEALESAFEEAYGRSVSDSKAIQERRHIDRLATECWYPALENALLKRPISRTEIVSTISATGRSAYSQRDNGKGKGQQKSVLLFGAGAGGAQTFFSLPNDLNCVAFVDNDPKKQKTEFFGKPVIAPAEIPKYKYDRIIISSMFVDSIEEQMLNIGIEPHKIERGFA
jgi:glycosyltransferase involved in cell wall biosynthesis